MVIFLTSSFVEYQPRQEYVPKPLINANGFADNLKKYWKEQANFLVFACNPEDAEEVDHVTREMHDAFSLAGFSIGEIRYFDNRSIERYRKQNGGRKPAEREALREALQWADVCFLAGGHAPTENAFIKQCDLKSLLGKPEIFDGIFIALSAGAMNSAKVAYLIPELPGESVDPGFVRFSEGLGLTGINVVPHSQYLTGVSLDGKKVIDEILAPDSYGRELYLITDNSYFMIRNGITEFFGEGSIMQNGVTRPLYEGIVRSDCAKLVKQEVTILDSIMEEYYEWVLEIDAESGRVDFFHAGNLLLENDILPVHIDSFDCLNQMFSQKLVVEEEKQPYLEQVQINVILDEIQNNGSYARTVHVDNGDGIRAESLRVNRIAGNNKRLLARLTDISMVLDHDWMTDKYSRDGFLSRAEKLMRESEYREGYSIVYTNIQGFKAVNDLLGAFSGDMIIFWMRDILEREFEPVLLARLESDHFALLTKTENLTEEKLDRVCHQRYEEGSKRLSLRIRCGIYHVKNPAKKVQHMLDRAKLAENSISSEHGAAYAVCDEKMRSDYVNQRVLVSEMDAALEKGEFQTYFQPIVDAKSGEIVSAEALVRWNHSKKGMIPPGEFVPVFEKEGLITKVDSFMLDRVLQFNIDRMKNGKKIIPCAVNLSRVDFFDMKLMDTLKKKVEQQTKIQQMLKLEITESAYVGIEQDAFGFLKELKTLGVSLLLDDFGSGMSSLSTLESFAFDTIKLDMGFIAKIGKSTKAESIIRHMIGLSHDVGAKVIAEGVENQQQLTFLQAADCDMIQGYHFYKPMPESEFIKLL